VLTGRFCPELLEVRPCLRRIFGNAGERAFKAGCLSCRGNASGGRFMIGDLNKIVGLNPVNFQIISLTLSLLDFLFPSYLIAPADNHCYQ